jgi:hypothetical protein
MHLSFEALGCEAAELMPAPDYTEMFNTKLPAEKEKEFRTWLDHSGRANDLFDYDLRGAFKDGLTADPRGHLPDTYKKPNHPTFSSESVYSSDETPGGDWLKQDGKWVFKPGPANLQNFGPSGLQQYFKQYEPDAELILPPLVQ